MFSIFVISTGGLVYVNNFHISRGSVRSDVCPGGILCRGMTIVPSNIDASMREYINACPSRRGLINRSLYRMYRSSSGDLSDCDRKQRIVAAAATWSWRETLRSVFLVIPSPLLRQFRTPSVHARYSRNIAETQTSRRGNFYAVPSRCFSHRDIKVWPTSIVPRKMPRDRN